MYRRDISEEFEQRNPKESVHILDRCHDAGLVPACQRAKYVTVPTHSYS